MTRTVTGLAIYPDKRIVEGTYAGLEDFQAIVDGYIEAVYLSDGTTMWVNEEFTYRFTAAEDVNWLASDVASLGGRPDFLLRPILGPVCIIGPASPSGDNTNITDKARRWVQRVAREAGGIYVTPEGI